MEETNLATPSASRRLHTEADLHHDQLEFFRSSNMLPSQQLEDEIGQDATDEYDLATLSMSRTAHTPTSSLLPEITERKVAPRRKRRQRPKQQPSRTGFPAVEEVGEKQSLFSKRQEKHNGIDETQIEDISQEVRETVAAMSLEEIQQAQQEIYASLKPENIEFLRQRRQKQKKGGDEKNTTHNLNHNSHSIEERNATVSKNDQKSGSECDIQLNTNNPILQKKKDKETVENDSSSPRTTNQEENRITKDDAKKTNIDLSQLLQKGSGNRNTTKDQEEHEEEKRKWMKDSSEHIESQASMDAMLEDTVKSLGPVGKARFNLDGQILTEEEVDNLPTHAGLHHHGSNPERAGYTLVDVLTLTRSTVVTQRIMSLKILTGMVQKYGNTIADALIDSGGLALIFSPFPSLPSFHAALTSHISFVEVVEAIIALKSESERICTEPDLYFASSYYSTSLFDKANSKLFELLTESECLPTLIQIAVKNSAPNANNELSVRALSMVKAVITHCESASQKILNDDVSIKGLMSIAQGYNERNLQIVPHACEVLKHVSLTTAWNDQDSLDKLGMTVFSDQYLHKLAIHVELLLHEIPAQVSTIRLECACSTIHVFRAALAFERGILPFATILQPISALCSYPNKIAVNSYLALEAYVHSLYTRAATSNHEQGEGGQLKSYDQKLEADFLNNQIAGLIPMAVSALTVFTASGSRHSIQKRAAAGHFSATLFASGGMLQDKSVVARIFNTCTEASTKIIDLRNNHDNLHAVQSYASVSHAGVRLLSKIQLELGYVKREVKALWRGLSFENDLLSEKNYAKFWRPLANCCAEWAGALSRTECSINSVERCLQLLPFLSDNQVIVDLLARGVLKVDALRALNLEISVEDGQRCAKELLPATLTELNSRLATIRQENSSSEEETPIATAQISLKDLIRLWSESEDTFRALEIFSRAIYKRNLVQNSVLLAALLQIPKSYYENKEESFHEIFKVARECVTKEEKLVDNIDETVVSSKSTTENSRLATAILGLADFLVSRGPQADLTFADGKQIDALASVVLAFLLREEIDISLRISLWRKAIEDCGGGFLFKEAFFLREGAFKSLSDQVNMLFFQSFCVGIQQGLFLGERSPNVLREAFCVYLATKLIRNGHESRVLRDAIETNTEACIESMRDILQIESVSSSERDFIVSWLSQNRLQIN